MMMTSRAIAVGFLSLLSQACAAAVGADAGVTDATRGDATLDATDASDALSCSVVPDALRAFIASNRRCTVDSDCVTVSAPCSPEQGDCCVVYLAGAHDRSLWSSLYGAQTSCVGGSGCGCCAAIPAPPGCINGQCGPRR